MSIEQYKSEMDRVAFSDDFEKRAIERIKSEGLGKKTHLKRVARVSVSLAACAAMLIMAITLYPWLNAPRAPEALIVNNNAQPGPEPTSIPILMADDVNSTLVNEEVESADYEAEYDLRAFSNAEMPFAPIAAPYPSIVVMDEVYKTDQYAPFMRYKQEDFNTSEYSRIIENRFLRSVDSPLSTFSASVDTASFTNVRGMLERGETPPADAVRIEEFINYFKYGYPAPKDNEPFSVTAEIATCPWNEESKLLLIGLATAPIETNNLPKSNLVFLIDVSGSMDEPNKLPLVQKAFLMLTEQLRDDDIVSIVTYAGYDRVVLDGVSGKDKARIADAIESLSAGGSTAGADGINTAYAIAWRHFIRGGNNRVILATVGDLNIGVTSEGELTRLIEEKRDTGIYLSVTGFGFGNYKDNKLEALAIHGKGNYNYINDAYDAKKVFVEEMGANLFTVCKDAKLQVEFNPAMVDEYRLIGYESRKMDAADFANDQKDGGQIGAGHQVTAMYEIKLADASAPTENSLKYQSVQTTGSAEYLTVSVRAKAPDGDVSAEYQYPVGEEALREARSENMAFAAAVAEFAMILRDSEYKGTSTYQSVAELLKGVDVAADPYKDDFAYMVRKMAR
jgi:Ca-activated chloride channel family protein